MYKKTAAGGSDTAAAEELVEATPINLFLQY